MSGVTAILRRSCQAAARENLMETCAGPCVYSGASLKKFSSCARNSIKPGISVLSQFKAVDRYSPVNVMSRTSIMPLSAHMDTNWLINSKLRSTALPGPLGVLSVRRAYSSDTGIKPEVPQNTVSNVPSTETSDFGATGASGNTWIDILDNACKSTTDATTDAGNKFKEMTDAITPHVHQFFEANPNLEKVVVPLGGTLFGTMMAWFVMPIILRRLHKYVSQSPVAVLLGNSTSTDVSYQTSLWSALEDPAKYLITFMAFSEMAAVIAPSISVYLPQAWRGACVLSLVWFLHRWKANFITNAMANQAAFNIDQAKLSGFNKVASLGLIALGVMGVAEACGVAVQSILTVGGVGGVATAFAARDVLGNMLSGFSLQFSSPFSVGEYIKAGSIEGTVVEIGLTSTLLMNSEKFPVTVPNSLFSSQVQWNVCHALSNLFMNDTLRLSDMAWASSVYSILLLLLRDSNNYKIRMHAAVALAVPVSRLDYGSSYPDVVRGLEHVLESLSSNNSSSPSNFKHRDNLEKQLTFTALHLLGFVSPKEDESLKDFLIKKASFLEDWLKSICSSFNNAEDQPLARETINDEDGFSPNVSQKVMLSSAVLSLLNVYTSGNQQTIAQRFEQLARSIA